MHFCVHSGGGVCKVGAVVCRSLSILDDGPLPKVSFFNADFRSVRDIAIGRRLDHPTSRCM